MLDLNMIIANNIQAELKKENKKQVDLAEEIGVSKQTMSKIMNGARAINAVELHKISEYLHLPDPAPADRTVGSERADGGGIQKKPRKSEREMTTPLFLLRCVQLGISIADLDLLTIGLVNDMFTERQNDEYPYKELASQEDFDRF